MQIRSFKTYLENTENKPYLYRYENELYEEDEGINDDEDAVANPTHYEAPALPNFDRIPNIIPGATVTLSIHCLERTGLRNITTEWILNTIKDFCKYHLRDIQSLHDESKFLIVGPEADIAIVKQDFGKIENYLVTTVHKTLYKRRDNKLYFMPNAINKQVEGSPTHYRYDYPEGTKVYQKTVHHRPSKVITLKLFNKFYSFTRQDLIDMTEGKKSRKVAAKNFVNEALDEISTETPYFQGRHMSNARPDSIVYVITDKTRKFHIVDGFYTVLKTLGYSLETKKFYPAYKNHDVNVKEISIDMIKNFDVSVNLNENTFKQYLDQLADKLSKPKMIVEYPVKSNQIQGSNMHKDNNNIAALLLDERIKNAERVDIDAIQEKSILDTFNVNELFETFPDSKEIVEFLSTLETTQGIVGHNYIYVSITTLPISKRITINHFTTPRKLVKIVDNQYYFDINDVIKGFPLVERTGGDMFRKSFLLDSIKDCNDLILLIKLRYSDWNINPTTFNESMIENKLILKIGDLAEKYKCSLMMVEMALKQGIREELKNIKDFKAAKLAALKNINKKLDYYKKTTT